jgi:hypothetical protein
MARSHAHQADRTRVPGSGELASASVLSLCELAERTGIARHYARQLWPVQIPAHRGGAGIHTLGPW